MIFYYKRFELVIVDQVEIEKQKAIVNERLKREDFLSLVNVLNKIEREVLRLLIKNNSALAIRTIRNEIIWNLANARIKEIFGTYYLPSLYPLTSQHFVDLSNEQKDKLIKNKTFPMSKDALKVFNAFQNDADLIKDGYAPLSFTDKIQTLEKALKISLAKKDRTGYIPSWDAIKGSLSSLKELGLVEERKLEGKRADTMYYASPILYSLWEQQNDAVQSKNKKTEAERFWFSD